MSQTPFRVIDTGLRTGRENIAFDQAMVEARAADDIPDTLRFIQFKPSALLGRHQVLRQEIKLDFCRANGVEIGRRITGGGAIYFDEGQLGWALVCKRNAVGGGALADLTRKICEAAAFGLSKLGVDARFRPRNDIEVDGRKISGTGGFFDGDTLIYQGTVLIDPDTETMFKALNVAKSKLQKRDLDDAAARVTSLKELLGKAPDRETVKTALTAGFAEMLDLQMEAGAIIEVEEKLARNLYSKEIGTDEFVAEIDDPARSPHIHTGSHSSDGGSVSAHIRLEGPRDARLREILFSGDFFVTPPRIVFDLEASLRGLETSVAAEAVQRFFAETPTSLLTIQPEDFAAALEQAIQSANSTHRVAS